MAASNLNTLQAALLLLLERLGEVCRRAFSRAPHPSSSRRPPEWEWGRPAHSSPLAASQTVRTLSQTVKESRPPHTFWITPSSSPRKTVFHPPGRLLWELRHSHESGVNHSGRHFMGLREFSDILSAVIVQFSRHIGDGSLCVARPPPPPFLLLHLW